MLPPGHIAAGYLTAYGVMHLLNNPFTPTETNLLLLAGAILGTLPDIDFIPFFLSRKSMRFTDEDSHRRYITHTPMLWLILGLIIALGAPDALIRALGLLIWLASWGHFIGDSIEYGVRWFWPFSKRYFSFGSYPDRDLRDEKTLINHYWGIIKIYSRKSLTFPLEVILVFTALAVIIRNH